MGAAFSCDSCPVATQNSVMTFSDDLILKLTEGIEPDTLSDEEYKKREMEDYQWFEKLHCIDKSHTLAYGLTQESVEVHIARIQKLVELLEKEAMENETDIMEKYCQKHNLIDCFKKNKECSINCYKQVQTFVKCVDMLYLEKVILNANTKKKQTTEAGADLKDEKGKGFDPKNPFAALVKKECDRPTRCELYKIKQRLRMPGNF